MTTIFMDKLTIQSGWTFLSGIRVDPVLGEDGIEAKSWFVGGSHELISMEVPMLTGFAQQSDPEVTRIVTEGGDIWSAGAGTEAYRARVALENAVNRVELMVKNRDSAPAPPYFVSAEPMKFVARHRCYLRLLPRTFIELADALCDIVRCGTFWNRARKGGREFGVSIMATDSKVRAETLLTTGDVLPIQVLSTDREPKVGVIVLGEQSPTRSLDIGGRFVSNAFEADVCLVGSDARLIKGDILIRRSSYDVWNQSTKIEIRVAEVLEIT